MAISIALYASPSPSIMSSTLVDTYADPLAIHVCLDKPKHFLEEGRNAILLFAIAISNAPLLGFRMSWGIAGASSNTGLRTLLKVLCRGLAFRGNRHQCCVDEQASL